VSDLPSQAESASPTSDEGADSAATDQLDPVESKDSGDRSSRGRLRAASLRHLAEVDKTSRQVAALVAGIKVAGDTTVGRLGLGSSDQEKWAGVFASGAVAAKLHLDLTGISKSCEQIAQAATKDASWRVGSGLAKGFAQALAKDASWRIRFGLNLKTGANFAGSLPLKVTGGSTLQHLAQNTKHHHKWTGAFATGAAAKLHRDLAGISRLSEGLARIVANEAGRRVGSDLSLKVGGRFAGRLAMKAIDGNGLGLLAQASSVHQEWASGAVSGAVAATLDRDLAGFSKLSERFASAVITRPRPVELGLTSGLDLEPSVSLAEWEAERRAAAYQADAAVPQLLTLMESQAQVMVGISEAIEELRGLARSSQASQKAEAVFNRRLEVAVLAASLLALLFTALAYFAPREAAPAPPMPQAPPGTVAAPHADVPTTATPAAGGGHSRGKEGR
jgi:hypothetical protein